MNVNWHLFPARFDPIKRQAIFSGLRKAGIGVQVNYIPAYWHPIFNDRGFKKGKYLLTQGKKKICFQPQEVPYKCLKDRIFELFHVSF